MRKPFALLLIILLPTLLAAQVNRALQSSSLVFNHVTVIDMTGSHPKPDMTIVIQGDRIVAIGKSAKSRIPKDARVIDATGKFLFPGLWDMHVHFGNEDFDKNYSLRLYLANGVTGIRLMDGDPAYHLWRKEAEGGALSAPLMFISSQMIGSGDRSYLSEARVREEVRNAKMEGADFIKVHDNFLNESYFALIDEAKRVKLFVAGHVPTSIKAAEASEAGQRSIEHSTGLDEAKADTKKAEELIAVFKKNHTWLCPTLIMRWSYAVLDDPSRANDPRLKYVKPRWKNGWLNQTNDTPKMPSSEWEQRKETVRKEKSLVAKMARSGIGILAGTDHVSPYIFAGFSLHDELAILVEAGLTPMQALQAATINPAKFLNKLDSLGTIEKGKRADLVLLDANPLENIRNTQRINAVVANGRYFSKEALQQILAEVEAAVKKK
jgi:imidazolonepropionase-like amidohydrolase